MDSLPSLRGLILHDANIAGMEVRFYQLKSVPCTAHGGTLVLFHSKRNLLLWPVDTCGASIDAKYGSTGQGATSIVGWASRDPVYFALGAAVQGFDSKENRNANQATRCHILCRGRSIYGFAAGR